MRVIFHKTSHGRHGFTCIRDDGSQTESPSLESKSYLRHDLMHFVFEKTAHLQHSFYGTIASGKNLEDMRTMDGGKKEDMSEIAVTEMLVATMQSAGRKEFNAEELVERLPEYLEVQGYDLPEFFTKEFIDQVTKEFRLLLMRWESLKTGEEMELTFPK